jgi:hypothetical protein
MESNLEADKLTTAVLRCASKTPARSRRNRPVFDDVSEEHHFNQFVTVIE